MAAQLLLNIAMFLPYGLLLPIAAHVLRKPVGTLTVVLLTTVSIETFQYFIGRSADVDDVIMNFVGGALGYLLFTWLNRRLRREAWWRHMLGTPLRPEEKRERLAVKI